MSDFRIKVIPAKVAREVVVKYHYSKAWPTGNFVSFGAFIFEKFCGVVTFGHPANMNGWKNLPGCESPRDLAELTRLWVADWAPPFVESRTIGAALRILRRDRICRVAVSYADPAQQHLGIVYQATNWIYVGQMDPSSQLKFSDGTMMHKRAAFDRFGTDNPQRLRSVDPYVQSVKVPGKHKYLYPVDKGLGHVLLELQKPYPCAGPERVTGVHPEKGGADPTPALHSDADGMETTSAAD